MRDPPVAAGSAPGGAGPRLAADAARPAERGDGDRPVSDNPHAASGAAPAAARARRAHPVPVFARTPVGTNAARAGKPPGRDQVDEPAAGAAGARPGPGAAVVVEVAAASAAPEVEGAERGLAREPPARAARSNAGVAGVVLAVEARGRVAAPAAIRVDVAGVGSAPAPGAVGAVGLAACAAGPGPLPAQLGDPRGAATARPAGGGRIDGPVHPDAAAGAEHDPAPGEGADGDVKVVGHPLDGAARRCGDRCCDHQGGAARGGHPGEAGAPVASVDEHLVIGGEPGRVRERQGGRRRGVDGEGGCDGREGPIEQADPVRARAAPAPGAGVVILPAVPGAERGVLGHGGRGAVRVDRGRGGRGVGRVHGRIEGGGGVERERGGLFALDGVVAARGEEGEEHRCSAYTEAAGSRGWSIRW